MKTLILVRHGDARDDAPTDKARILSEQGEAEAVKAGQFLLSESYMPQKILHSDAVRTTSTAKIIADVLQLPQHLFVEPALYNATVPQWFNVINALEDQYSLVMAVGHNLGISRFAHELTHQQFPDMQTCSVHIIELPVSTWQAVGPGVGQLIKTFTPS